MAKTTAVVELLRKFQESRSKKDRDSFFKAVFIKYSMLITGWWMAKDPGMCLESLKDLVSEIICDTFLYKEDYWLNDFTLHSSTDDGVFDFITRKAFLRFFRTYQRTGWFKLVTELRDCQKLIGCVFNEVENVIKVAEKSRSKEIIFKNITSSQKDVIELKLEGVSDNVIAFRLGLTPNAVRNRYFRAISSIQDKLINGRLEF